MSSQFVAALRKRPEKPLLMGHLFAALLGYHRGGNRMKSHPDDEPGIFVFYALVMFAAFVAAGVIAAAMVIHFGF
jgi:hypothetical protein